MQVSILVKIKCDITAVENESEYMTMLNEHVSFVNICIKFAVEDFYCHCKIHLLPQLSTYKHECQCRAEKASRFSLA
jgi:hypothetical protein